MISVAQATSLIVSSVTRQPVETVPVTAAVGRALAQTIVAERDQPPFNRVMMDGVAVASATGTRRFARQAGIAAAGKPQQALQSPQHAIEVMTGAPLPRGADCVVPVEQIEHDGDQLALAEDAVLTAGRFVHGRGSDHAAGSTLLDTGRQVRSAEVAVLVSAGQAEVAVFRRPSIGIVASGDELIDVGAPIADHQIRRSNDYAIEAMLHANGFDDTRRAVVADDKQRVRDVLSEQLAQADVLVLSGGVSMGKYDYLPQVLEALSVELVFHRVSQRPGKPMWFGVSADGQPVFALPGNPVSALTCCRRYVVGALRATCGLPDADLQRLVLAEAVDFAPAMTYFLPVSQDSDNPGVARPQPTNTSGDFAGLTRSAGFVELPAGQDHFEAGYEARFFPW